MERHTAVTPLGDHRKSERFLTVHDLALSNDEQKVWGSLPRTAHDYPLIDGMSPQDSALSHMFLVCLDRRDYVGARRCASLMTNAEEGEARLGLIPAGSTM